VCVSAPGLLPPCVVAPVRLSRYLPRQPRSSSRGIVSRINSASRCVCTVPHARAGGCTWREAGRLEPQRGDMALRGGDALTASRSTGSDTRCIRSGLQMQRLAAKRRPLALGEASGQAPAGFRSAENVTVATNVASGLEISG